MEEKFYIILTKIGREKIANATALGELVGLTKFQVGDSNGEYYEPTEEQTALKNVVWEGNINSLRIDEKNPNWIVIETILPGTVGGFMIREAAVLDNENNIIAIGKYPETYKPRAEDGSIKDLVVKMILQLSNTSNVTLEVDPTLVFVTQKDIQDLDDKFDKNIKEIKVNIGDVNILTTYSKDLSGAINEVVKKIENISFDDVISGQIQTDISVLKNSYNKLSEKVLDILIYLELESEVTVDEAGYWYDTLANGNNIVAIEGLKLDLNRKCITGEIGNVIFRDVVFPFSANRVRYIHDMDNNFVETKSSNTYLKEQKDITLNKYSYEIR
ncbi:phage tail protein [Clostridioides difficile]|uniref:phage tail protein n=1 Tax=Clostridioides difficile TaxID=1496 RepID=UPI000BB1C133|nr:phage tail protein [Clostridioides difficile]PBI44868.1 phage tail protein [Clostridioides difficile]